MLRQENGITLVALIITIIVLIILAAVTIMAVTKNGMIDKAIQGTENYANAQYYEVNELEHASNTLNKVVSNITAIEKSWKEALDAKWNSTGTGSSSDAGTGSDA